MSKGTPSHGRKSGKRTHIHCRRCGHKAYHATKKVCAKCGYGRMARIRRYSWAKLKK